MPSATHTRDMLAPDQAEGEAVKKYVLSRTSRMVLGRGKELHALQHHATMWWAKSAAALLDQMSIVAELLLERGLFATVKDSMTTQHQLVPDCIPARPLVIKSEWRLVLFTFCQERA